MGWTYTHRAAGMTTAEFLAKEFGAEYASRVRDTATVGGVFYALYETEAAKEPRLVPDESGNVRLCLVVLIKNSSGEYNFGWKDMDEFMGPCEATCPARILDRLSPIAPGFDPDTGAAWASNWRKRCREHAETQAHKIKLRDGMTVRLPEAVTFRNGDKVDTFTVQMRGRKVLFRNGGCAYRLPPRLQTILQAV